MDIATALWVLVPLAAVHLVLARRRQNLAFQLLVDAALLAMPLRPLAAGAHAGPGIAAAAPWGAATTVSGSPEQSDLPLQFTVWWEEVRRLVAAGEPPWISDRIGGGIPLFAHGQTGLPFPLQLPVWVLGSDRGSDVMVVWKLELAALGGFFLLRRLAVRSAAAAFGALAYSFGLYMLSWVVVPLAWVVAAAPWAVRSLVGALRGGRGDAALLALILGTLAGWSVHPESAAFLWLAVAGLGLALAWGRRRRLLRLAAPLALAVAVAGVGALPTLAAVADSAKLSAARSGPQYPAPDVDTDLRLRAAALLAVPWREGYPADGTWRWPFAAAAVSVSIGVAPLVLLVAARPRRRHRRTTAALAVVGATAALLLWQVPGVAHVLARLPVLGWMVWSRAAFLVSLSVAVLAALAADAWLRRPRRWRLAAACLGLQAATAALVVSSPSSSPRRHLWPTALAPAALAALVPLVAPSGGWLLPAIALTECAVSASSLMPGSVATSTSPPLAAALQRRVAAEGGRVLGLAAALPANLAARAGLADLRSNEPMRPRSLAALDLALGSDGLNLPGPVSLPWAALAGAWGVRWLATPESGLPAGAVAAGWVESYRDRDGRIFRNSRALPVLRLAERAVPPPAREARDGGWEGVDFASTAVVAYPPRLGGHGTLEVLSQRPSRVVARVAAEGDVLAVMHAPRTMGWTVSVDGRTAPLLTADLAAMAVVVPPGVHEVRFEYWPTGLIPGAALTLAGLVGCVLLPHRRRVR